MSKIVKKTYGKKAGWDARSSKAFDEAKNESPNSSQSPKKLVRPSIWAKVPLFESLSPQKTKKQGPLAFSPAKDVTGASSDLKGSPKKKGRKRKNEDIFGFGDLDDDVTPATAYISPKKKKKEGEGSDGEISPSKNKNKNGKIGVQGKMNKIQSKVVAKKKGTVKSPKSKVKSPTKSPGNSKIKSPSKAPQKGKIKSPTKSQQESKTKSPTKSPKKGKSTSEASSKQKSKGGRKKQSEKSPKKDTQMNKKLTEAKPKNIRNSKKLSNSKASPKKYTKSQKNGKRSASSETVSPKKQKLNTPIESRDNSPAKKLKKDTKDMKSPVVKELFGKSAKNSESSINDSEVNNEQTTIEESAVYDQPVIKRKRGRPPKKQPRKIGSNKSTPEVEESSKTKVDTQDLSQGTKSDLSQVKDNSSSQDTIIVCSSNSENTPQTDGTLLGSEITDVLHGKDCSAETADCSQIETESSTQTSSKDSKSTASGSPFKWFLKNNEKTLSPRRVAQLRRISVLPTCTPKEDDDDDGNEVDTVPFGLSWAMQTDDNALRVNKEEKGLFTIVRNTKQAHESVEFGESQQFKDDVDYLLDGIGESNSLSTRCLSLLELASKCSKSAFRMHLRAHGTVSLIFEKLNDATSNQNLSLCTASVMFMLTRDRQSIDFDKSILEMMLKLLAVEEDEETCKSKEWQRLTTKLKSLFEKNEIQGIDNLDLSQLTSASLARESFLSLTLQRTGAWFKEEIRLLGGLDHIVDTVVSCSKILVKPGIQPESNANLRQIERCLKLLENVTGQCVTNQRYLIAYRNSALLECCSRLLKYAVNCLSNEEGNDRDDLAAMWFSAMKILLSLTHDNEEAGTKFCQQTDILSVLLRSAFQLPRFLPEPKQFDVTVLSLGLLINLVEYSKKNIAALNAATAPARYESSQYAKEALDESEDHVALELLVQLFLERLEAAKDNNGMEEDLSKLNDSLHNSSVRIGRDGLSLVCGDDLDSTQNNDESVCKRDSIESASGGKTAAEEKAEHLGKTLQRAAKHMEDSLIASYAALLISLLAEDNQENQERIHEKLVDGDFGVMKHTLDKFLAFMNMTASPASASSSEVIQRAINVLGKCMENYPAKRNLEESSSTQENGIALSAGSSSQPEETSSRPENSSCQPEESICTTEE